MHKDEEKNIISRRSFFQNLLNWGVAGAVLTAFGYITSFSARFLFAGKEGFKKWFYLTRANALKPGESMQYTSPVGEKITVRCFEESGKAGFQALSSTCPHLGCQVEWQGQNNRFFCPCHNGVFNPEGVAIEGPPAKAGQKLAQYNVENKNGLVFIEVPVVELSAHTVETGATCKKEEV